MSPLLLQELINDYTVCKHCGRNVLFVKIWLAVTALGECGNLSAKQTLHKKMKFSIKDFFSKCTEEIPNEKLHFLCSETVVNLINLHIDQSYQKEAIETATRGVL